jgi:hypothetical protein
MIVAMLQRRELRVFVLEDTDSEGVISEDSVIEVCSQMLYRARHRRMSRLLASFLHKSGYGVEELGTKVRF